MEFVFRNHIEDRGQLREMQAAAERQIQELAAQRKKLYRTAPGCPESKAIGAEITKLRKTVRLCKAVEGHSLQMEERLRQSRSREERKPKDIRKERSI